MSINLFCMIFTDLFLCVASVNTTTLNKAALSDHARNLFGVR